MDPMCGLESRPSHPMSSLKLYPTTVLKFFVTMALLSLMRMLAHMGQTGEIAVGQSTVGLLKSEGIHAWLMRLPVKYSHGQTTFI